MEDNRKMKVNKKLLPVKAAYFFTLAGVGSLLPYLGVYMKQVGLSASEASTIFGFMPFVSAFLRPLFGVIADKLHRHKLLLLLCCVMTGILHAVLLFVPANQDAGMLRDRVSVVYCHDDSVYIMRDCKNIIHTCEDNRIAERKINNTQTNACLLTCIQQHSNINFSKICIENDQNCYFINYNTINIEENIMNVTTENTSSIYDYSTCMTGPENLEVCSNASYHTCNLQCENTDDCLTTTTSKKFGTLFMTFFIIYLLAQIAFSPIFSLIDAITYTYLGDDRNRWGQQRLWGTIGFASFTLISTLYMDVFSKSETKDYTAAFALFAAHNIVAAICVYRFDSDDSEVHCQNFFKGFTSLVKVPAVTCLFVVVSAFGIYQGVLEVFLFWHLHNLGASHVLFGLTLVANCIPEVIIFACSPWLLARIPHMIIMVLALFSVAIRFIVYYFLVEPWWVMTVEPLHCMTYALMYASASAYGSKIAPPGMQATVQGLISGLYFGFGKGIGSFISGYVIEAFGAAVMFLAYGVSALIFIVPYVPAMHFINKHRKKNEDNISTAAVNGDKKSPDGDMKLENYESETESMMKNHVDI